jgi:hypothetical protein
MEKINRYVAEIQMYVYAKSKEEASEKINILCKEQDDKEDNGCTVVKLVEVPL